MPSGSPEGPTTSTKPDSATGKPKKGVSLKVVLIILGLAVVLVIAGLGAKKFLLKPKTTTASIPITDTIPPSTTPAATTATKPAARSDDPEMATWTGPVVGASGSDTFFIDKDGTRTQVELDQVYTPGYGTLVSEMERKAREIVTGTVRVEPVTVEHGINQCTAKVTLSGGRDAAETLATAGWVAPSDNASPTIKDLAQKAETEQRGMHPSPSTGSLHGRTRDGFGEPAGPVYRNSARRGY